MLLLGDEAPFIEGLSLVRDKVLINEVLSLRDNNPVFGVLLLGDETPFIEGLSLVRDEVLINDV